MRFGQKHLVRPACSQPKLQACERYEAACRLRGGSHAALYNWGVALSDLARHARGSGDADAAQQFLLASAQKYGQSLKWNPNNPQASAAIVYSSFVLAQLARACRGGSRSSSARGLDCNPHRLVS